MRALKSHQSPPPLRVLLLSSDPRGTELITEAIRRVYPECTVRSVGTQQAFVQALDAFAPDVIVGNHPVGSFHAIDALRLTQARRLETPLLLVAAVFEESASESLRAGATDFVSLSDLSRLEQAIDAALKRREPLRKLSKRQRQVLQLLAAGCSTREIARRLRVSVKTVETHRAQVMKRLEIHDLAGLVRYAVRVGIVSAAQRRTTYSVAFHRSSFP